MKCLSLCLLVAFFSATTLLSQTQPPLPEPLDSLVINGTDLIMQQRYDEALRYFQQVSEEFPQSPEGYLFQAATIQARAMDFRDFRESDQFDSLLVVSRKLSEEMIEREPESPWGYYYLGTTLGMDSYDKIQRGDYLSGYFKGRSAVSEIEKTLELDSTFNDCYSVLGTYYYWKSRKTEFLHWLPFFSDDREKGIQYLQRAVEKGRYQRYPALSNLIWVYLDASNVVEAEQLARRGLQLYPRQRAFLHALGGALQAQRRYAEAKDAYERQLQEILSIQVPNDYNEIGCRLNIVWMQRELRDTTQVREHLSVILSKQNGQFPEVLQEKLRQHFDYASRFEQELSSGTFTAQ